MGGGILTFSRALVAAELAKVLAAPKHRSLYDEVTGPGLWIVGDQGVYLMGNHEGRDPEAEKVVYAKECDPSEGGHDWYDRKVALFGGDDGVDFLGAETIQRWLDAHPDATLIRIRLFPNSMEFL
jgi:hypothetical protein